MNYTTFLGNFTMKGQDQYSLLPSEDQLDIDTKQGKGSAKIAEILRGIRSKLAGASRYKREQSQWDLVCDSDSEGVSSN